MASALAQRRPCTASAASLASTSVSVARMPAGALCRPRSAGLASCVARLQPVPNLLSLRRTAPVLPSLLPQRAFATVPKRRNSGVPGIVALAAPSSTSPPKKEEGSGIFSVLTDRLLRPLMDFGFGRRTVWEGGVGIFVLVGIGMFGLLLGWIKGIFVGARLHKYHAIVEFSQACGITVGTPVRIRGVDVGSVIGVRPSLERIDVHMEINDAAVIIPRNALVEVNQSGLISETLIDITPQKPTPEPRYGPLDEGCAEEGLIVCDRERIKGHRGVSLDELVSICTKIAHQMDENGMDKIFNAANTMAKAVEEYQPLLQQAELVASEVAPLLRELRNGELFTRLEALTEVAVSAANDVRRLNNAVITDENTELLRESVATLTKTLKHIESISKDVSGLTGDPNTRNNLRQLIQSLSRMVSD
eukprot:jgi/Mesvir1/14308/Mv09729-RA.1